MTEHASENTRYKIDGPMYRDGSWMIKIVLSEQQDVAEVVGLGGLYKTPQTV